MAVRGGRGLAARARAASSRVGAGAAGVIGVTLLAGATAGALALLAPAHWRGPLLLVGAVLPLIAAVGAVAALRRFGAASRDGAAARDEPLAPDAAIAAVAHDIRSPLLTVHSYLELLASDAFGTLPADARRAARRATQAAGRAQSLVEEAVRQQALRTATRSSEPATPPAEPVDLQAVLDEVVVSLEAELAAARAQVEVQDLPRVRGDGAALYRVFANLLQNAVKYGAPGTPPRVVVSAVVEGDRCEIAVRDWGAGIAPEERERVFEPRVRGEHVAGRPGTGIGLATVRGLVTQQSGRVWADPTVTDGACIRISLPAA